MSPLRRPVFHTTKIQRHVELHFWETDSNFRGVGFLLRTFGETLLILSGQNILAICDIDLSLQLLYIAKYCKILFMTETLYSFVYLYIHSVKVRLYLSECPFIQPSTREHLYNSGSGFWVTKKSKTNHWLMTNALFRNSSQTCMEFGHSIHGSNTGDSAAS
jgi:hypothetical protein